MNRLNDDVRMGKQLSRRGCLRCAGATAGMWLLHLLSQPIRRAAAAAPRKGGTVVYASENEATTMDPPYVSDGSSVNASSMIYNNLVKYTPDLKIQPDLATGWTVDRTAWTFKLRRGVTFHDGTSFDAHAVEAHFGRLLGPEKPLRASQWVPFVERVQALDAMTVQFTTKFADPFFLDRLASPTGAIESPTAFAKYGKDMARHPVGTGPFRFREWVQDQHIALVRNDRFWGGAPHLDGLVIRPTPDINARVIALTAGEVQLARGIPPEQVARIEADPRLAIRTVDGLSTWFIGINVLKKPFTDVRVRQALNYAVDKVAIVKTIYGGMGTISNNVVARGAVGFSPVPGFPYNPAKAKQLLAEAGYQNGFSATMLITNGAYPKELELEQFIQEQWAAVGVRVTLQTSEYVRYLELLRMPPTSSPLEMWIDSWGQVEAAQAIVARFGCKSFRPAGQNTAGFCNEELDGWLAEAQRTLDQTARNGILGRAQALVSQQAPAVWLIQLKQIVGMSKKLNNPVLIKTGLIAADEHTWLEA